MNKCTELATKLRKLIKNDAFYFPSIEKSYIFAVQKISNK